MQVMKVDILKLSDILLVMLPLSTIHVGIRVTPSIHLDFQLLKTKIGNSWKLKWYHLVGKCHSHHESTSPDTMFLKLVDLYMITFPNTNTPQIMEDRHTLKGHKRR